ncbi:MAG TPA: DNA-3-methyladenine glycosylase I, partial [Ilumatobacteraceae bacterium]|nr:DNA-3-methyladenine glycosylase I [Ilumatobacteraceae bacterium]
MSELSEPTRCGWATHHAEEAHYHDTVWGVPQYDPVTLFEYLTLEGAQAGLSWHTILLRKDGYRDAFDQWDIARIAAYTEADVAARMLDTRIIRNRGKITSTVTNARIWQSLADPADYIWSNVGGVPIQTGAITMADVPGFTPVSDAMSKRMKKDGFRFVGTTICYAYMQACGLVNDHVADCWRHAPCTALA